MMADIEVAYHIKQISIYFNGISVAHYNVFILVIIRFFCLRNGAILGLLCDNRLRCFEVGWDLRLFAKF